MADRADGLHQASNAGEARQAAENQPGSEAGAVAYNLATVRLLLLRAFEPGKLRSFCQDRPAFRDVVDDFQQGGSNRAMVDTLIDYCEARDLFPELLSQVQKVNPRQFARYEKKLYLDPAAAARVGALREKARPRASPPGASLSLTIGERAKVRGTIKMAGGNITEEAPSSAPLRPETRRAMFRSSALLIGGLGLMVGVLWLTRVGPALTLEFAIPLALILLALGIGAVGLLMPDWIEDLLGGPGDEGRER